MSERRTAYLLLLAMAVCFGGTWPAGKLAVDDVQVRAADPARMDTHEHLSGAALGNRDGSVFERGARCGGHHGLHVRHDSHGRRGWHNTTM